MSCENCNAACPSAKRAHTPGGAGAPHENRSGSDDIGGEGRTVVTLLGQPNSGKSTLFNGLTGARQHVGNWAGKTVERKVGAFEHGGRAYEVVDLPGSYSLSANSPEEVVTRDFIASAAADVTVVLADASQLERSLYMLADFVGVDCPCVLALNLMDVAESQGKRVDAALLERRLGIPVVPLVASEPKRYGALYGAIERAVAKHATVDVSDLARRASERLGDAWDGLVGSLPAEGAGVHGRVWLAEKLAEGDAAARALLDGRMAPDALDALDAAVRRVERGQQGIGAAKFSWIESLLEGAVEGGTGARSLSRFDALATGSRWSKPITVGMILLGFVLAFVPAIPIMMLGGCFSSLGQVVAASLAAAGAPDVLGSFLAGVVFNSLCFGTMMVGYVFGINLVFGLYEESGYMARISYVFDRTMARFGLQGKSLMPFLMCLGCTMGGVSGSRVIDSWGQRMLTVMMAWAIPCGSTWGVVPVLAVAFFGWGAPLVIIGIFVVVILMMWLVGRIFGRYLVADDERAGLVMELPPYHKPHLKNVARTAALKSRQMFVRAIRVVAIFAFAIWALTYTGTGSVEGSALYMLGTAIEPVTRFFGLGWETFTAWLCALVLKESALGVLSALFTGAATPNSVIVGVMTGGAAAAGNIGELMAAAISAPEALAFIFAFTFNMPCAASVSATWGEVHSTKWTVITAAFYIVSSLVLACVVYHVSALFLL